MQISTQDKDFVIDPLVKLDLKPLVALMSRKPLILHGADFDLRILKKTFGFMPLEIFDTMIAAQFLGYDKQGLSDLARKHCAVELPKGAQKADWSERPLDEKLLIYAGNDTHYLKTISDLMKDELTGLGRLPWHRQTCEKLIRTTQLSHDHKAGDDIAWQVKGSKALSGAALTILKELWIWREAEARRRDRPSFKIMNSEILIDLARWSSANPGMDAALMPKAPRHVRNEHRDTLNRILEEAKSKPQAQFTRKPFLSKSRSWTEASTQRLGAMKADREKLALELKIHPSLLAANAVLETLALAAPKNRQGLEVLGCLLPWQIDVMGESFLKIGNLI